MTPSRAELRIPIEQTRDDFRARSLIDFLRSHLSNPKTHFVAAMIDTFTNEFYKTYCDLNSS